MKFILAAQIYWPVWLVLYYYGHSWLGVVLGAAVSLFATSALWRLEFGTWRIGG